MRLVFLLFVVLMFLACPSQSPVVPDASVAGLDAGAPLDAGPPPPSVLEPMVRATRTDGAVQVIDEDGLVEEAVTVLATLPRGLKDFRVRLLDWQDKVVSSDDTLGDDGVYVIRPLDPLKSGRSYRLAIDAETGPELTGEAGAVWDDFELTFRMAGEVQPEPKPAKPAKATKKKRR